MSWLIKFELNLISVFPVNAWKLLDQLEPRKGWNWAEQDEKLIRLGQAGNELANQIWPQSDQHFVCILTETTQQIQSKKMARIQRSMTTEEYHKERTHQVWDQSMIGLCRNVRKSQKCGEWRDVWMDKQTDKPIPMSPVNPVDGGQYCMTNHALRIFWSWVRLFANHFQKWHSHN